MALPATGTTTRDGSCCCGAVCGCPEPQPDEMCAVVTGVTGACGCDPAAEVTLVRGDPPFNDYLWSGYADLSGCTPTVRMTVTVTCATGPPGAFNVQVQFGQTAAPFNICVYSNDSIFVGDGGAGCDPFFIDTAAGGNAWSEGGSGFCSCFPDAASIAVTVSAGPCGAPLMAATALKTAPAPEPPCRWRGEELTGPERSALSLDHRKAWHRCGRPDFPRLGLPVTDCRACKPVDMRCGKAGCTGYEPADVDGRPDV